ncbi:bifunctional 4-hydroxy-2-oxoglutarate aldolase/2-dehydro-3-deoxy-phosphogluconate aldolase [Lactovum odontotermitis]
MELSKATLILRGYTLSQTQTLARLLAEQGRQVKTMEIALNTPNALEIIKSIHDEYKDRLMVGAGTVQNFAELKSAIAAGAQFVLSPRMMSRQMLDYCKEHHVLSVPGAYTPSEIGQMFDEGADYVKVFPANEHSIGYARKVCEPMGDMKLMAVGGVTRENVKRHFDGGYALIGTAGGIFRKEDIIAGDEEALSLALSQFEQEIV